MQKLRFDVFGRDITIETTAAGWVAFVPGNDRKRRPAGFPIPATMDAQDIAQYLDDLFHENATAEHPVVRRL
jgi:hypothetical protein